MKRKLLSIFITIFLIISLTGCDKSIKKDNTADRNVTKTGKLDLELESISSFHEDRARFISNKKYGFIDKLGNVVVEAQYDFVMNYSDGLALVCNKDLENSDFYNHKNLCGYIDKNGNVVIDLKYEDGTDFVNGTAIVKKGIRAAFIDKTGKELTGFDYTYVSSSLLGDDMAMVSSTDVKTGAAGWNIISIKDGYKPILANDATVMNCLGCTNGLCVVKQAYVNGQYDINGKYGYVDYSGNIVIDYQFDTAFAFGNNGLALVVVNDKVGFIDTKGNYVIKPTYKNFTAGLVKYNSDITVLNKDDNNIVAFDNDGKELFTAKGQFYEDGFQEEYALIRKKGYDEFVFIDENGKEVFNTYVSANSFSDGLALVKTSKDEFQFINNKGKTILGGKLVESVSGQNQNKTSKEKSKNLTEKEKNNKNSDDNRNSNSSDTNKTTNTTSDNTDKTPTNSDNNNQNQDTSTSNTTNTNNLENNSADGIKIGNALIKYGTYNGDAAVMGETLIINADGTAILNGETFTYHVGKHNFAQDSSSNTNEDALILEGSYTTYYYIENNGNILSQGSGMDYIYWH